MTHTLRTITVNLFVTLSLLCICIFIHVPQQDATYPSNCNSSWVNGYSLNGQCTESNASIDTLGLNTVTNGSSQYCGLNSECYPSDMQACVVIENNTCYPGSNSSGVSRQPVSGGCQRNNSAPSVPCPKNWTLSLKVSASGNQNIQGITFKIKNEGWNNFPERTTPVITDGNGDASLDLYSGDKFQIVMPSGYTFNTDDSNGNASCTSNYCEMNAIGSCGTALGNGNGYGPCTFEIITAPPPPANGTFSGNIFLDNPDDEDTQMDNQDQTFKSGGSKVTIQTKGGQNSNTISVDSSGTYTFSNLKAGNWCVSLSTVPSTYKLTNSTQGQNCQSVNNNKSGNADFGLIPANNGIQGTVYVDTNNDQKLDNGESGYTGSTNSITFTGTKNATAPIQNDGTYDTGITLPPGSYTVKYPQPPAGYYITYPLNGTPPSFNVVIGTGCANSIQNLNDAKCDSNNNITNLDFGIVNSKPWYQSYCGDLRDDTGINDPIPQGASCQGTSCPYAISTTSECTNGPGIVYSGDTYPVLGKGQASPYNWAVGGTNSDIFKPMNPNVITTSYTYMTQRAQQAGIPITDIAKQCNPSSCTLDNLQHGTYQTDPNNPTDLHIATSHLSGSQNYVIFVSGNLYIDGEIKVDPGSTLMFSVAGNISVDPTVGTSPTDQNPNIEGFFSTDKSFLIPSASGTCTDTRLNIAGSVVVNAAQKGGSFQPLRNLCASNATSPAVTFTQRLDFLLYAPDMIRQSYHQWQEVAP